MSFEAAAAALRQKIGNPYAKLVLISIAEHHNRSTGLCFPSVRTMMKDTDCCRRTVFYALKELEALGLIERVNKFDKDGNGRQMSNHYNLLFLPEETPKTTRVHEVHGKECTPCTGEGASMCTPLTRNKEPRKTKHEERRKHVDLQANPRLLAPPLKKRNWDRETEKFYNQYVEQYGFHCEEPPDPGDVLTAFGNMEMVGGKEDIVIDTWESPLYQEARAALHDHHAYLIALKSTENRINERIKHPVTSECVRILIALIISGEDCSLSEAINRFAEITKQLYGDTGRWVNAWGGVAKQLAGKYC